MDTDVHMQVVFGASEIQLAANRDRQCAHHFKNKILQRLPGNRI
jgi:hypothetical protein